MYHYYMYFETSPKEFGERYIGSNIQRKRAIKRKRGLLKCFFEL